MPLETPRTLNDFWLADDWDSNCPYAEDPQRLVKWGVGFRLEASEPAGVWEVVLSTLGSLYYVDRSLVCGLRNRLREQAWFDCLESVKCPDRPWDVVNAVCGPFRLSFDLAILNRRSQFV